MAPRWHLDHTSTNISVGFRDIETTQLPVCQESYERCWVWGVGLSLLHKIPDTQFASFKIQHWIWKIWETFGSVWRDISHEQLLETSFFSTKCTNAHYGPCWRFCFVPVSDSGHERIPVNGQRQHLTVIVVHETHGTRSTESIESGTTGTTGMIDVSWGSPDCALWQSLQMDVALHVAWCCYNFWKFTKLQKMYVKTVKRTFSASQGTSDRPDFLESTLRLRLPALRSEELPPRVGGSQRSLKKGQCQQTSLEDVLFFFHKESIERNTTWNHMKPQYEWWNSHETHWNMIQELSLGVFISMPLRPLQEILTDLIGTVLSPEG